MKIMSLCQVQAAKEMEDFLKEIFIIEKIAIKGSTLNPDSIDLYSDVDMEIHLLESTALDSKCLIKALSEQFCGVFGYEVYSYDNRDIFRICFDSGMRYDLTFIYQHTKKLYASDKSFSENVDGIINQFWFVASMVLIKLGRRDYLIASHLALELCQLIIVIQMLIRDNEKNTNIHKFGDAEDVPILHSLVRLKNSFGSAEGDTVADISSILSQASEYMDEIATNLNLGYRKKSEVLKTMRHMMGDGDTKR